MKPEKIIHICTMITKNSTFYFLFSLIVVIVTITLFNRCATIGRPTGGDKDSIPPEITFADPEFYTTNFNSKRVNIGFSEYVQLKYLNK